LEEIKVRWKKAALENCTGVPCIIIPPPPPPPSFTCGTSTVSDIDGNAYPTVSIGTQCWTKTNLKVTKYNDGTVIPLNNTYTSGTVSTVWQGLTTGAYTIYGNESSTGTNATNYGFLYNWYAATDSRKLCPAGWHVPTDGEWTTLIQSTVPTETLLTGTTQSTTAGGKMKSTSSLWTSPNIGAVSTSGFSALPGGIRQNNGSFSDIRTDTFFWSATEFGINQAWNRNLENSSSNVYRDNYHNSDIKSSGLSVRCLRD
jgi:uncharacterized protein (TIGR02145 family)